MVQRAEAVLPAEVRFNAPRVATFTEEDSASALEDDLDILDEA